MLSITRITCFASASMLAAVSVSGRSKVGPKTVARLEPDMRLAGSSAIKASSLMTLNKNRSGVAG